jgi:hypothetical protein
MFYAQYREVTVWHSLSHPRRRRWRPDSFGEFLDGIYKMDHQPFYREIDRAPEARQSTVIHTINESIDISVFDRWRSNPTYRPPKLQTPCSQPASREQSGARTASLGSRALSPR